MGWLRKKGRQLDKRIRKIFGKNAWLKVAMLVGGGYMYGTGNYAGPLTPSGGGGPLQFIKDLGTSVKNFFWDTGTQASWKTPPGGGTPVYVPATKGGLSWTGQVATNIGSNIALGVAQQSMQPLQGQQAGFAPQENSAVNKAVMASNAAYGANGSILDAYRNFDFGPASTTMLVESARNRNISRNYIS